MRSSTVLALLGAGLAIATPVNNHDHLHKKAIVYDIVTDMVYVTVTQSAESTPANVYYQSTVVVAPGTSESTSSSSSTKHVHSHSKQTSSSTSVAPVPTTSTTPLPVPTTTSEALTTSSEAPAPTTEASAPTTEAPVSTTEVPSTTSEAPTVEAPTTTSSVATVAATTAAKAVAEADTSSDTNFTSTGVDKHNSCRSSHSAEEVAWNTTLAGYAAITAKTCVFAHDMTEGGGGYGQNIASQGSSSSTAWTAESALENAIISEWYSEASMFTSLYGEESPSGGGDWLHFTQIVWKNSLEIGCAVQACPTNNAIFPGMYAWFTVCNYYPQGNILGEFAENVLSS